MTQLDHAFGMLMRALDEMKLTGNTVVFFTSDNGPEGSGKPDLKNPGSQRDRTRGSTGGLRGRKRDDYEGGIRVPGTVRWPGHIKAGIQSDIPVIGSDIFSTICDIVEMPLPDDRVIDGARTDVVVQRVSGLSRRMVVLRCSRPPHETASRFVHLAHLRAQRLLGCGAKSSPTRSLTNDNFVIRLGVVESTGKCSNCHLELAD